MVTISSSVTKLAPPSQRAAPAAVAELARHILEASGRSALRRVTCSFHEGVLTLRGSVPSFYLKQLAQTLVRRLREVEIIENHLEVPPGDFAG